MTSWEEVRPEKKLTQTERAYHIIKKAVLKGEIEEGKFVSEEELSRRYRIGRTPFREACNRLHNEQILEVVPRRGYFVQQLSFRSYGDLVEARLLLEGDIAEIAAIRATEEEIRELEGIVDRFSTAKVSQADPEGAITLNSEFHLCMARMTQNRELVDLEKRMLERTERLFYVEYRRSGLPMMLTRQLHQPIADAIRRHDPAAARQFVRNDILQMQARSIVPGINDNRRDDFPHGPRAKRPRVRRGRQKSDASPVDTVSKPPLR